MAVANIYPADVVGLAPELSTVTDSVWVDVLQYVNELDLTCRGATMIVTRMARLLLAAHIATMLKRGGSLSAGPVISEAAGGVRRAYAQIAQLGNSSYGATRYGQEYLDLLSMSAAARGPLVV